MAVITSAASGNFSAPATWVGGVVPGVSDDAVAATTHVVTIDTNVTVISVQQAGTGKFVLGNGRTLTGNVIANAGTFTSGGTVEVTATSGNTATINGNVTGVSSTAVNVAGVVMNGSGALVINGNVTGSAGNAPDVNSFHAAVFSNTTSSITVNGAVNGGSGNEKVGIRCSSLFAGTLTVNGNVNAVSNRGYGITFSGNNGILYLTGNAIAANTGSGSNASWGVGMFGTTSQLFMTGNAIGGNGGQSSGVLIGGANASATITGNIIAADLSTGYGLWLSGSNSTATIIGNVTGSLTGTSTPGINMTGTFNTVTVTGNVNGSAGNQSYGIFASGTNSLINIVGTVTGGTLLNHGVRSDATTANFGVIFDGNMIDGSSGVKAIYTRIFRIATNVSGYTRYQNNVGFPSGTPVFRVSPDNVTGMPAASNVRKPVVYGYSNQLTGTMAVPSAATVRFGVPVDNTTGTAELDLNRVAEIIGLQVAAGKSV